MVFSLLIKRHSYVKTRSWPFIRKHCLSILLVQNQHYIFRYIINASNMMHRMCIWFRFIDVSYQSNLSIYFRVASLALDQYWENHCPRANEANLKDGINTLRLIKKNATILQTKFSNVIFLDENIWILLKISLKFVCKFQMNNIPALVQMMIWRRTGDKPLSEPIMVSLLTHIWVIRPQCVWIVWIHIGLYRKNIGCHF